MSVYVMSTVLSFGTVMSRMNGLPERITNRGCLNQHVALQMSGGRDDAVARLDENYPVVQHAPKQVVDLPGDLTAPAATSRALLDHADPLSASQRPEQRRHVERMQPRR